MGKYMRKCGKGAGEVAVMEVSPVAGSGVRTRARAALALAAAAASAKDGAGTKRKVGDGDRFRISYLQLRSRSVVLTTGKTRRTSAAVESRSTAASGSASASGTAAARNSGPDDRGWECDRGSRCSSNAPSSSEVLPTAERASSSESVRPSLPKVVDDGSETTACNYDGGDLHRCWERTLSSEVREWEFGNLESTARPTESRGATPATAPPPPPPPSEAEIEAFFAAAEREECKRFVQKYNYDVVNDVPLQGRYEWLQIKP